MENDVKSSRALAWVEIGKAEPTASGMVRVLCRCRCGVERPVILKNLRSGATLSCGCEQRVYRKHGHTVARADGADYRQGTYNSWRSMVERCSYSGHASWDRYGGRGIAVCERWRDFVAFLDDMGERPDGTSLERMDANGNYEPGNCRWATLDEQANNKRTSHFLEHDGRKMTVTQWERHLGFPRNRLFRRLAAGWTAERALTTPSPAQGRIAA